MRWYLQGPSYPIKFHDYPLMRYRETSFRKVEVKTILSHSFSGNRLIEHTFLTGHPSHSPLKLTGGSPGLVWQLIM